MTLNEIPYSSLGVEERSDEAPKGRPRQSDPWPGGRGQADAEPVHRGVSSADPLGCQRRGEKSHFLRTNGFPTERTDL